MPVPVRWATPCTGAPAPTLYAFTRNRPDEGEFFLQDGTQTIKRFRYDDPDPDFRNDHQRQNDLDRT